MSGTVTVIDHPLVQHKITRLRSTETESGLFRSLCHEVTLLAAYEALRDLPTVPVEVTTPLTTTQSPTLDGPPPVVVGILRAGLVMVEAILELIPQAAVGHLGMARDPDTHEAVPYYRRLPPAVEGREIILVDPMLATGGSAILALDELAAAGARPGRLLSIIGCPEGVEAVHDAHPEVDITLATMDERLNENAYIVPGLGDAGDRIYGTE
ncbi:MAG: uracil phosphoribosyltransferase [Actinomycetota bacterium]